MPRPQTLLTTLQFLSRNNGFSNAFTATTNTNYYFNVATSALAGALERFSGFFHSPLFSPSSTVRELNAVDSEHKQNLQSDMYRILQVDKHLTKPGHVWSKFGTGDKVTLTSTARKLIQDSVKKKGTDGSATSPDLESSDDGGPIGREIRRRVVEWWGKEYYAGRMRLCVIGKGVTSCPSPIAAALMHT
jgi:insulysin